MLKVRYPQLTNTNLAEKYVECLGFSRKLCDEFNLLRGLNSNILNNIALEDICKMTFEEIIGEFESYKSITSAANFLVLFNYDKFQSKIKTFVETYFDLRNCYYCGIDFINSFNLLHDFHDENDFLQRANEEQLSMIYGIGTSYAAKIINWRASNGLYNVRGIIRENIKSRKVSKNFSKSLFTLDHVLDKANNPFFALSLYNLVPSCYACNSKLKHTKALVQTKNDIILSPTYEKFKFTDDVKFKIVFYNGKKIDNVASINDFVIELDDKLGCYKNYIEIFYLLERHISYKKEILHLIKLRQRYTDTYIKQMVKSYYHVDEKNTVLQLKKNIFGIEIFDGELDAKPLTKIKRDIAKQIGII